jgi:hypothetical protein
MECRTVSHQGPSGPVTVIVCGRRTGPRCHECKASSRYQCDFPLPGGRTCDRDLCGVHRVAQGPGRDYCRTHDEFAKRPSPNATGESAA